MSLGGILTQKQQNFILDLSSEIKTQDNLATANPYFYILTQKTTQVRPDTHAGDYVLYLDFETEIYNNDELIEYTADDYPILTEWLEDNLEEVRDVMSLNIDDGLKRVQSEYADFSNDHYNMSIVYYEEVQEASKDNLNVFLTRKAYDEHVKANSHHYKNPKPYIKHMFRNPEMESMLDILHTLAHSITMKEEKVCIFTKNGKGVKRSGHYKTGCGELFYTIHGAVGQGTLEKFCPCCGCAIEEASNEQ